MAKSWSRGDFAAAFAQITDLGQMLEQRRNEKERIRLANEANQRAAMDQSYQNAERERELPFRQEATSAGYDSPGQHTAALNADVIRRKKEADDAAARTARATYLQRKVGEGRLTEDQAFGMSQGLSSDLNEGTVMSLEKPEAEGRIQGLVRLMDDPNPKIADGARREYAALGEQGRAPAKTMDERIEEAVANGLAKLIAEEKIASARAKAAPPAARLDYPVAEDAMDRLMRENRAQPAPFNVEMEQRSPAEFMPEAQRAVPGPDTKAPKVDAKAAAIEQKKRDYVQTIADNIFESDQRVKPTPELLALTDRLARAGTEAERKLIMAPYTRPDGKLDPKKLAGLYTISGAE